MIKLFDTSDYNNVDLEFGEIEDDLRYVLEENVVTPRGELVGFMFESRRSSHYGSICNNGQTGYCQKMTDDLAEAILSIHAGDEITVYNDDGQLYVSYSDHDGSHNCKVHPITKSKVDVIDRKSHSFDKLLEYVENMPVIKIKK